MAPADSWSGVPSHVTPDSRSSWGLPAVTSQQLPAVTSHQPPASESSWGGGDDWSSEDESVHDTRLMPPPQSAAPGQLLPARQQLTGKNSYGSGFQTAR